MTIAAAATSRAPSRHRPRKRSCARYTAFTRGAYEYIGSTFAPRTAAAVHAKAASDWAATGTYRCLRVLAAERGGPNDKIGFVEFVATYTQNGEGWDHHETSRFERAADGHWLYVGGNSHRHREGEDHHHGHHHDHGHSGGHGARTLRRDAPKAGRNDPCPCGSGKKFKKCCGA